MWCSSPTECEHHITRECLLHLNSVRLADFLSRDLWHLRTYFCAAEAKIDGDVSRHISSRVEILLMGGKDFDESGLPPEYPQVQKIASHDARELAQ